MGTNNPSRLEMLGNLFTAIITVVLSGQCDLLLQDSGFVVSKNPELSHIDLRDFNMGRYRGITTEVSKVTGYSRDYVAAVARGKHRSDSITKAILDKIAERNSQQQLERVLPLSDEERHEFLRGHKYHSLIAEVTKELGISRTAIQTNDSPRGLRLLREKMVAIDSGKEQPRLRYIKKRRHGTRFMYQQGCRCDNCKAAEREISRKYRQRRKESR